MRTCPRCNTALTAAEYEGVSIDACGRCGGEWLDEGELKQIIDAREREWDPRDIEEVQRARVRGVPVAAVREELPCPACGQPMTTLNYAGDSGILVDRCPSCRGVWLDGGELEKAQMIVEASDQALREDLRRFSARLRSLSVREEARTVGDSRRSVAPGTSALLYRVLDI